MELLIETKLAEVMPKKIEFNYAPIKTELTEKLAYYKNLVVTEDSIKPAKSDRAWLNSLKKTLNDKKISVKKDYLVTYDEFEREIKELMSMIDEPITAIDTQLKAFEEQQRAEKQAKIEEYYSESIGELSPLLPLTKIFNPKWLNTATSAKSIKTELTETIGKVKSDIDIIKAMHIECEQTMLDAYLCTLSMSDALAEKNRYEARQAALKEYEAKQAEKAAEAVEPITETHLWHPNEIPSEPEVPQEPEIIDPTTAPDFWSTFPKEQSQEETKDVMVIFYATTAEFRAEMKELTVKHGISYGDI